ncbi:MAG: ankyrin repeat domain-containing protein [Verrucomicrobia bacterium]|nr:ankyrin repeat domain-containing protein [Verrucomicrobiota bacterium]
MPLLVFGADDLKGHLQRGLFEEEANRNLPAAITAYQAVLTQFDKDRELAATAVFRLGECYRKLEKTNEAVTCYQRVVREFADNTMLGKLSRQNLTALGVAPVDATMPATASGGAAPGYSPEVRAKLKELLTEQLELAEANLAEMKRRVEVGVYPPLEAARFEKEVLGRKRELLAVDAPLSPAARAEWKKWLQEEIKLAEKALEEENKKLAVGKSTPIERTRLQMEILALKREVVLSEAGEAPLVLRKSANSDLVEVRPPTEEETELRRLQAMVKDSPDLVNAPSAPPPEMTPLQRAAAKGYANVVRFLLANGADMNLAGANEWTALHYATDAGHRAVVEALLAGKAEVNPASSRDSVLHVAAKRGFVKLAELLITNQADVNHRGSGGATPLHAAISSGNRAVAELLLSKGADVRTKDAKGVTPLHLAARRDDLPILELLLSRKAEVNATDDNDETPLGVAVRSAENSVVELLLKHGADVNVGYTAKGSLLHEVIPTVRLDTLQLLLSHKPDLAKRNSRGFTVLQALLMRIATGPANQPTVVTREKPEIVAALAKAGADPNDPFYPQEANAISVSLSLDGARPPNYIGSFGTYLFNIVGCAPVLLASAANQLGTVKALLAAGAKVNVKSSDGYSPLHYAVFSRSLPFVQAVLAHSPDTEIRDRQGYTPLTRAVEAGDVSICEALLKAGANPKATDRGDGMTPLFRAAGKLNKSLVQLLLDHKADVNHVDQKGRTVLDLIKPGADNPASANAEAYREIVELLLKHGARSGKEIKVPEKP